MAGLHDTFAPSASDRIVACPASVRACADEPDKPSVYAARGSAGHRVADECLGDGTAPSRFLGVTIVVDERTPDVVESMRLLGEAAESHDAYFQIEIDDELIAGVERYMAWVLADKGDHYRESRVDISSYCPIPNQFGTADYAVCRDGHLILTDLKMGAGVQVYAEENTQLILYALGYIAGYDYIYDFERVTIRICQPLLGHFDVWETTKTHLLQRGEWIKSRFALATRPDAPFGASEKGCRFCKIKYKCRAYEQYAIGIPALAHDRLTMAFATPDITHLTTDEMVEAWERSPVISQRIKAIVEHLTDRVKGGETIHGLKLVEGRSTRAWLDETAAKNWLVANTGKTDQDLYKVEFVTPSAAQDFVRGKERRQEFQALVKTTPGKPSVVPQGDRRRSISDKLSSAFDDAMFN